MKSKIVGVGVMVVAGLVASGPLYALAGGSRVKAEVPFAFSAGGENLPAGEYTIQKGGATHLVVRDRDREVRAIVYVAGGGESPDEARLTFHRYGHRSFLASVEGPGFGARDVVPSAEERAIAASIEQGTRYKVDVDSTIEP